MQTLIQTISNIETQGIFTYIKNQLTEVPEYLTDSNTLNLAYYYNHSGNKITSPIIDKMTNEVDQLTAEQSTQLAKIILSAYKDNWDKLYNALTIDYSPIENVEEFYNETVDSTGNKKTSNTGTNKGTDNHKYGGTDTKTNTGTDTNAQSGTDSTTNTGTQTDAQTGTDTTNNTGTQKNENANKNGTTETINGLAGFNSDEYNKDNKSTTTVNQTITDTRTDNLKQTLEHGLTDTRTDDLTEATTYGKTDTRTVDNTETTNYNNTDDETIDITNTNTGSEDTTGKDTIERHRHGNIGVTTNQYMINEEIELRKHYFNEYLFADVDRILTIPIY